MPPLDSYPSTRRTKQPGEQADGRSPAITVDAVKLDDRKLRLEPRGGVRGLADIESRRRQGRVDDSIGARASRSTHDRLVDGKAERRRDDRRLNSAIPSFTWAIIALGA